MSRAWEPCLKRASQRRGYTGAPISESGAAAFGEHDKLPGDMAFDRGSNSQVWELQPLGSLLFLLLFLVFLLARVGARFPHGVTD